MLNTQNRRGFGHKSFMATPLAFFISIIMVFTMIPVTGFVVTTDTSYAATGVSWVGGDSFDYYATSAGGADKGWTWSHPSGGGHLPLLCRA